MSQKSSSIRITDTDRHAGSTSTPPLAQAAGGSQNRARRWEALAGSGRTWPLSVAEEHARQDQKAGQKEQLEPHGCGRSHGPRHWRDPLWLRTLAADEPP